MQKDKLKQYSGLLIIGILLIVVYKVFEPSWFSVLLNACFPIIIGGVLAYFLEPLVQMVTKLFENCQSSFLKKHRKDSISNDYFVIDLVNSYGYGLCSRIC